MSQRPRTLLVVFMVILMAAMAFIAGYMTNDFVAARLADVDSADIEILEGDLGVFWEAWDKIEENFIGDFPDQKAINYGAIRGSLQTLNDPYTVFLEPVVRSEERESLRGNYGGVGASLTRDEASGEVILEPIPGNPAANAGILSGDVLLAIDGVDVPSDETTDSIASRIRGEIGTTVVLAVRHPNESERVDVTIERSEILIPSVSWRLLRQDSTIGYIQLSRFSGESGNEVKNAILSLREQGAQRYVLDLRNNGGGLLDAAVLVSDNFLAEQVVYNQLTRNEDMRSESTFADTTLPNAPLVLLVNGGTASSAEIVAGALQDHQRAILIGERTFGKGSVQLVYDLSDESSVHVTWARWLTPNERQIDQNGLQPDIEMIPTQEGIDNGRDEPLDRAVLFLQTGQ